MKILNINFNRITASRFFMVLSVAIYFFILSILILTPINFFLKLKIFHLIAPVSFFLSFIIIFFAVKYYFKDKIISIYLIVLSALIIIYGFSYLISNLIYDISWDGQDYHQVGIIKIYEGYNPFFEDISENVSADKRVAIWVNHYPKASWICAASIYAVTGNIEHGKIINFLLIISTLFLSLSLLFKLQKIKLKYAFWISIALTFNPIVVYESLSYYIDGMLSCLVTSLIIVSIIIMFIKKRFFVYIMLSSISLMLINLKFTGAVFTFIFLAGLFIALLLYKKIKTALIIFSLSSAIFILGVSYIGYSPYIRNFIEHNHPFYPIYGKDKIDIITWNYPENFKDMNRFQKTFHSIFSKTGTDFDRGLFKPSKLKIPFTMSDDEFLMLSGGDARVGGFGPLFSGVVVLSIVLFISIIRISFQTTKSKRFIVVLYIIIIILISVFIISECWWARYIPQLWIVPIAVSILFFYSNIKIIKRSTTYTEYDRSRTMGILNTSMIITMMINISLIFLCYAVRVIWMNEGMINQLNYMKNSKKQIVFHLERFELATRLKLKKWDINYVEDNSKGTIKLEFDADRAKQYFEGYETEKKFELFWNYWLNEACILKEGKGIKYDK